MPPPAPRRVPRALRAEGQARLRALLGAAQEPLDLGWTPEADAADPPLVDPGRRGVTALALTALLVLVVVAVTAWRHRPHPIPAPLPLPAASSPAAAGSLVVDVEGAVRRPGLLTLPHGSRVADAVRAAGGLRAGVTSAGVNLARLVVDGEQLVIGTAPAGTAAEPAAGALLDLNTATAAQLDALPGVGPVLAQRIVDWRTEHGPFRDVGQLREVSGIGEAKYADLEKKVRV